MEIEAFFRAHGWDFFRFKEGESRDAATVAPRVYEDGPVIEWNPWLVAPDELSAPSHCMFWIPMVLNHFCCTMLHEALCDEDETALVGCLGGPGWRQFRAELCKHLTMEWATVVGAVDREGEEYVAESMALAMFVESGMQDRLMAMRDGGPHLRAV